MVRFQAWDSRLSPCGGHITSRPALKWGPPDASEGDGRQRGRGKAKLICPWESHEKAGTEESAGQRDAWGSGRSTGQGVRGQGLVQGGHCLPL